MELKISQCQNTDGTCLADSIAQTGDDDAGASEQEEEGEPKRKTHSNESGSTKDTELQFWSSLLNLVQETEKNQQHSPSILGHVLYCYVIYVNTRLIQLYTVIVICVGMLLIPFKDN